MTERLYLRDPYRREFQGRVVAARRDEGRPGAILELDRTAFYPTSGGQLHDTGILADRRVVEVVEEDNRILHRVDGAGPVQAFVGRDVSGRIDWERRFDHMQQHTGQHILSQAALRELGAATLAVHLGAARCTVDLDVATFGVDESARVEDAANAVVVETRPVSIHFVDEAEIGRWGLRRPPQKSGTIRVIDIDGFDRSACGGTHVRATGEIGAIAIIGWERYKGGARVEFVCGWRALRDHRVKTRAFADMRRVLSVSGPEVVAVVERLAARERETARRAEETLQRLLAAEADLRRRTLTLPAVLTEVVTGRQLDEVRGLAQALIRDGGIVALIATDDGRVVFARSADVSVDVAALLRRAVDQYGGRGGGRSEFAQGTLTDGTAVQEVLETARRWAAEALSGA